MTKNGNILTKNGNKVTKSGNVLFLSQFVKKIDSKPETQKKPDPASFGADFFKVFSYNPIIYLPDSVFSRFSRNNRDFQARFFSVENFKISEKPEILPIEYDKNLLFPVSLPEFFAAMIDIHETEIRFSKFSFFGKNISLNGLPLKTDYSGNYEHGKNNDIIINTCKYDYQENPSGVDPKSSLYAAWFACLTDKGKTENYSISKAVDSFCLAFLPDSIVSIINYFDGSAMEFIHPTIKQERGLA